MQEKIKKEEDRLYSMHQFIESAVAAYLHTHPYILTSEEQENLTMLMNRMFVNELDFLHKNPGTYFDLYADEM